MIEKTLISALLAHWLRAIIETVSLLQCLPGVLKRSAAVCGAELSALKALKGLGWEFRFWVVVAS